VLFGSTLLGVLGALVAIPIAASVQIAIREWWDFRHDQTMNDLIAPTGPTPADTPPPAPAV
jgi:predicted PurR-regulated permease PerM